MLLDYRIALVHSPHTEMSNAHSQQAFHLMYRDDNELSAHHVYVPGISGTMRFRRSNKLKMNLKIGLLL